MSGEMRAPGVGAIRHGRAGYVCILVLLGGEVAHDSQGRQDL